MGWPPSNAWDGLMAAPPLHSIEAFTAEAHLRQRMTMRYVAGIVIAAVACSPQRAPPTPDPPASDLRGTWAFVVFRDSHQVMAGSMTFDQDSARTARYALIGPQSVDQCLPREGQVFGGIGRDSVHFMINPGQSHCGLTLQGPVRQDSLRGRWCKEEMINPCGASETAWVGTFLMVRR